VERNPPIGQGLELVSLVHAVSSALKDVDDVGAIT
jgi:hypothetical protein